jgi:hypothetical protein
MKSHHHNQGKTHDPLRSSTDFAARKDPLLDHKKSSQALADSVADVRKAGQIHCQKAPKTRERSGERDEGFGGGARGELSEIDAIKGDRKAIDWVKIVAADVLFWEEHGFGLRSLDLSIAQPLP